MHSLVDRETFAPGARDREFDIPEEEVAVQRVQAEVEAT